MKLSSLLFLLLATFHNVDASPLVPQHLQPHRRQIQQQQQQGQQQPQHAELQLKQCTETLAPADALNPLCFVTDTVSSEAQTFLKSRLGITPSLNWTDTAAGKLAAAAFNNVTGPGSAAAAAKFLQDVRNDTIGGVPVTIGTPYGMKPRNARKLLIHAHGGAYVRGSCYHYWHVTAMMAQLAGVQVLCFEYRLAFDAPFPAALDDALAVYTALITSNRYKPRNIAFVGDSAGGGLALALLLKAKQQRLPLPGALLLMSPWADLTKSGDTQTTLTGVDPILQYELNLAQPALTYVNGDKELLQQPLVSPLKADAAAFEGFPPTLIQVGLRDSFLSLSTMLHRKLTSVGVESTVSPWEGMWHVFQGANGVVPEAQEAQREMAKFLVKHLKLAS
ncbi:Alpha/Beta hydrolase protein [Scenedesmus sp. NREL 46B-D3]|nr:Alpha/Beta hydrolase protein [Scenedesmus sp. NREL 46B-D3]